MNVLVITGDKRFGPGNERYELQRSAVDQLQVLYWGKGAVLPRIPKGHFDVVTVQDPFWRGVFGWWVARSRNTHLNVQVHTDLSKQRFIKHVLAQIVLRHADSVRVVSEKLKQQVQGMGIGATVSVVPVYIDIERFQKVVREKSERKTILWIGRFEKEKNPKKAFGILEAVQKAGIDAELVMLGAGSMRELLLQSAHNMKGLTVEDWRDPLTYYARADVVVSTSDYEGYGASIIEALAAGVPVVAPDVGIAKEAGARVVPHHTLAQEVIRVLQEGASGTLNPSFVLSKDEWIRRFRESLEDGSVSR